MVSKGLSKASMASVALDVFHSNCAVNVLDHFEFTVFDPITGVVIYEDEDHESYSMRNHGQDLTRIADKLPRFYSVTLNAVAEGQAAVKIGEVVIAADNKSSARDKTHNVLWDDRLTCASCTPSYSVVCLKAA